MNGDDVQQILQEMQKLRSQMREIDSKLVDLLREVQAIKNRVNQPR